MTLAIQRPQRTYDAQTILEHNDVHGLLKVLDAEIARRGEDGDYSTAYFVGAYIAVALLTNGKLERWTDFMREFSAALKGRIGID